MHRHPGNIDRTTLGNYGLLSSNRDVNDLLAMVQVNTIQACM